ncbi:MAG: zinc ribbon domain-containing protein [Desulfurellales bacterium]|nr:MAG: zinc ribbon domain-containing protein [Desulfurellales bacterium]
MKIGAVMPQTLVDIVFTAYHSPMDGNPLDSVREVITAWTDRQEHGIIADIARIADVNRSTVERLIAEHDIKASSLLSILMAVKKLGGPDRFPGINMVHEESSEYGPKTITLNFECKSCGKMTPGRPPALYCMHCGELLGVACPSCSHVNVYGAKWCVECTTPLNENVSKLAREIDQLDETPKERRKREDKAKELKRRDRRKRGIPEI